MAAQHVDVFIIGGGQAGIPLAHELVAEGRRVALAEREHLGGSCVNFGCTPTKAALTSARLAHLARRASDYGLRIPEVTPDLAAVLKRAHDIAVQFRSGLEDRFQDLDNPTLLRGHARFEGRGPDGFRLRVREQEITAEQVVVNAGARTLVPPVEGLEAVDFIHAGNWLSRPTLPEHVIVVGGSYIGLEMGQFYRRMGSQVSVVHSGKYLTGREDEDVAAALQEVLEAEGITFYLNRRAEHVALKAGRLHVEIGSPDGETETIEGSHLFVATGRRPNTDDLGLDTIGLEPDEKGFIEVDERLATAVDGVWAAGDVRGGPQFTHTSFDDYRVLRSQLLGDGAKTTRRVVPYAMFTDPQLGRVGMSEQAAREAGKNVRVATYEMVNNGKANEIGETAGFIKVVVDGDTDRLLGAAVLASEGAELVHAYIDVMNADVPYTVIRDAVHIHPTLSEAVQSALTSFG